jgi:hypothetical protein
VSKLDPRQTLITLPDEIPWQVPDVAPPDSVAEAVHNQVPTYADRPIGIDATGTRTEFDSLGTVEVPADRYWGAQTQFDSIVKPINMIGYGLAGAQ